ncbi:hypothetical protein F5890DRAFT_1476563 [Lentinula detonsa]|uniref:Uncharacterized protein n=1 Tax=Lentinula detonsa TaxID=2804962 RepID=A0AA38PUN4_9AGAR|nr:hypothetical protein F5890DRAFT_1476563 [Lentinula detonsa]
MELRDVVKEYMAARASAFKGSTILAAWQKSGICPLNPGIFTEADYAPSVTSSTQIQLPKSFPRRLPRAPDAPSDDAEFNPERERERAESSSGSSGSDSSSLEETNSSDDEDFVGSDDDMDQRNLPSISPRPHRNLPPGPISGPSMESRSQTRQRSSIPLPPSSGRLEVIRLQQEIVDLRRRVLVAEGNTLTLQAERDAAMVHAVLAGQEAAVYKHCLNKRNQKKDSSKCFATDARVVTSREGKQQAKAEAAKKAAKKKVDDERQKRKKDLEREDILRRAAQEKESAAFSGSIKSKSKRELQDILFALGLEADGTVAVLQVRINAHFDATPSLKENPRRVTAAIKVQTIPVFARAPPDATRKFMKNVRALLEWF